MFDRKFMLITIFLVCLLAVSAVSASEDNTTDDTIGVDAGEDAVAVDQSQALSASPATFSSLNDAINGNKERNVYLTENYIFESGTDDAFRDGITINRAVTIHGNFRTIDANHSARIFKVSHSNVVFENIIFCNGNSTEGGAIYGNCNAIGCFFIDNHANSSGGAMYGGAADRCVFEDNSAGYDGGAMAKGTARDSSFLSNSAVFGGALSGCGAEDCAFYYNLADYGGAMFNGSASQSIFFDNSASLFGGAANDVSAKDCNFSNNTAGYGGGAIMGGDAFNCMFDINSADYDGGAAYGIFAEKCSFTDNNALGYGGGMFCCTAVDAVFNGNSAGADGNDSYDSKLFIGTSIAVSPSTIVYNANKYLVATLKDSAGNAISGVNVTVEVMGVKYPLKTDANGQIKQSLSSLPPKTHTIKLAFDGNVKYYKSAKSVKVTVKKATPKITAAKKTFKRSVKTKQYTITLKDNFNRVMKSKWVTLKVNKKTYKVKTNSNGKATFKITNLKNRGTFTAVVRFAGNAYYNARSVTSKIIVR